MFIKVRLLNGFKEPLLYQIPENWDSNNLIGKIIKIPLRKKKVLGIIEDVVEKTKTKFVVKFADSIESFPEDKTYKNLIDQLSYYYQTDSLLFIKRLQHFIKDKKVDEVENLDILQSHENKTNKLTDEQQIVFDFLSRKIIDQLYTPTLLHGVTGSGKTEIYKKLIVHAIENQKTVLLMLPEITLAIQFEALLSKTLENIKIFSFHSAINPKQKKLLWDALLEKKPILIIGVHLPILLPISNLGLIIIDEEHETGYQEKKHPKINSKEAAILKAKLNNIPILLGSATPSITSLYNVKQKGWYFFQLKKRFGGSFPKIEIVQLNDKKDRKNFWISSKLENEIKKTIEKKEQAIIFLNRRGFSFFVQCKNCSFIFKCKNCSVSLTFHKNNWLYCHYCNFSMQYPNFCEQCKQGNDNFLKKGIGTEQVVMILEKMFPHAKIARADLDTTSKKKQWQQTITDFKNNKIDILIGTQTITKGYHFPKVTLVGILWADLNLHFPIFNASETSLQQLIQVAGRAGRQNNESKVIVQTMIEHKIFRYLNEIDYLNFFNQEIDERKLTLYPPHIRLAEIEFKHKDELIVESESMKFNNALIDQKDLNLIILGPVKPPIERLKNQFIRKIYIKSKSLNQIINAFSKINIKDYKSKISLTPNPTN